METQRKSPGQGEHRLGEVEKNPASCKFTECGGGHCRRLQFEALEVGGSSDEGGICVNRCNELHNFWAFVLGTCSGDLEQEHV